MINTSKPKKLIGRAELVDFPEAGFTAVPARVDTGASISAIWASSIVETGDGKLQFTFFGTASPFYTGEVFEVPHFEKTAIISSMGEREERYKVQILVKVGGKRVRSRMTLADRSTQTYPVLLGRNVLRGKFIVDVTQTSPVYHEEHIPTPGQKSKLTPKELS